MSAPPKQPLPKTGQVSQQSQTKVDYKDGVLGKIEGDDWHRPPEEGELPPYREAALNAWEKAKEAGAGKFRPGGLDDDPQDRLRAPLDTQQQQREAEKQEPVPPPVRSVLTFGANATMAMSSSIKASPGVQGGLFYKNRSFCFSAGFRDGVRGMDEDDKGNYLKMKDPLGMQRLSIVFFGHLIWKMHQEGHMDMFAPICTIIPELSDRKFDGLFPRDILNFLNGMDDAVILKAFGINNPSFDNYHETVTLPLNKLLTPKPTIDPLPSRPRGSENLPPPKFGACGAAPVDADTEVTAIKMGYLMRKNLVDKMVDVAPKLPKMFKRRHPKPSHFAISLLCAALERKMGEPMEEIFRKQITEPLGIMSVGFGIPSILYRSSMFWQPTGLPHTHLAMKQHIPPGDARHSASPVFNPSLNLFGNPEDTAKLLCDCFGSARQAVEKLPRSAMTGQTYHELGWLYVPHKRRFFCKTQWSNLASRKSPVEFTPYGASAMYDDNKDAGAFCVTNCGSRRAQFVANFGPQLIAHLFIRQCIDTGMDLQPTDETGHIVEDEKKKLVGTKETKISYTKEGKEYRASPAAESASASFKNTTNMKLTKEEQIAEMKRLSEEAKAASDQHTSSWFGRAQSFFKSGSMNSDGFKRF